MTTALGQLPDPLAGLPVQRRQAHPIIAQKADELDLLEVRNGLTAGGNRIRTIGPSLGAYASTTR